MLAAVLAMLALFWYFRDVPRATHASIPVSPPVFAFPDEEKLAGRRADGGELRALRRRVDAARKERNEGYEEISRLSAASPAASAATGIEAVTAPVPGVAPEQDTEAPAGPERRTFSGTWFHARPKAEASESAFYPPVFIETVIVEEGARLRGRYRARYQVADRAISPEVAFRFEATVGSDAVDFAWSGTGGAKGEGSLRLVGENSMEVKWTALELGTQMGLASGTALLIRRQEP